MSDEVGQFDVLIVGGGPAGMAAAVWSDDLGLSSCLIESSSSFGGQLRWIHNPITNYIGAEFPNGDNCLRSFSKTLSNHRFTPITDYRVMSIDPAFCKVSLDDGREISAKAIVLATGVRRRKLDAPGEAEFKGKGILDSGSRDKAETSGHKAAVVGGGDAALENALILADHAEKVYLIHRGDKFSAREEFIKAVKRHERIEVVLNARVREFGGSSDLEFVDIELASGGSSRIAVENAVIRIGVQPNSELLRGIAALDNAGYINVDREGRTSAPGIFAIGDVANPMSPTISTAAGSASSAIKSIAASIRKTE